MTVLCVAVTRCGILPHIIMVQITLPCLRGGGKKKITMAPSFGVTDFPAERKEEFATYLNSFSQLSIREKSGADIIRQLTGRDTQVVIDPTLMFKADEWEKIEECPSWLKNKKYLLTYTWVISIKKNGFSSLLRNIILM